MYIRNMEQLAARGTDLPGNPNGALAAHDDTLGPEEIAMDFELSAWLGPDGEIEADLEPKRKRLCGGRKRSRVRLAVKWRRMKPPEAIARIRVQGEDKLTKALQTTEWSPLKSATKDRDDAQK